MQHVIEGPALVNGVSKGLWLYGTGDGQGDTYAMPSLLLKSEVITTDVPGYPFRITLWPHHYSIPVGLIDWHITGFC